MAGASGDEAMEEQGIDGPELRPGRHIVRGPEFRSVVTIDARRTRRAAPARDAPAMRVLVLGDSFTLGMQVDDEEVFTARLEEGLRAGPVPQAEVLNLGMNGVGTAYASWLLERRARELGADEALLVFFVGNDLVDNGQIDVGEPRAGDVALLPRLASRSMLGALAWGAWLQVAGERGLEHERLQRDLLTVLDPTRRGAAEEANRSALRGLERACRRNQIRCRVALAPPTWAISPARLDATLAYLGVDAARLDSYEEASREVAGWVPRSMEVLDLHEPLAAAARERPHEALYLPLDGHWTARGHEVVADALLEAFGASTGQVPSNAAPGPGAGPGAPASASDQVRP